jgi:hypothetical protein
MSVESVRSVEFSMHNPCLIFWCSDIPPTDILIPRLLPTQEGGQV